jgi:phage-related minor tail protein
MADSTLDPLSSTVASGNELYSLSTDLEMRSASLANSANIFAGAMTRAFSQATVGGKQFDDVLKSLALRISSLTVAQALKPITGSLATTITGGLNQLFGGLFSGIGQITTQGNRLGAVKPFAAGGIIGTPSYFPLTSGGLGLAGEAGPEAIVPLSRGSDGRLGIAMSGAGQPPNITVQIATPDPASFRRSEAYITGQIARAVARGQRSQ